jgi:hypothetical protein
MLKRVPTLLLYTFVLLGVVGGTCDGEGSLPAGDPPDVRLSLNGVAEDLDDLLVVPPTGAWATAEITPGGDPIDPSSLRAFLIPWGGTALDVTPLFIETAYGALGLLFVVGPANGSYSLSLSIADQAGRTASTTQGFAIRAYPNEPPIGQGQQIWLDFAVDRDAVPGPDFRVDLQSFGLGSPLAPGPSLEAEAWVIQAVVDRVREAYSGIEDPLGFGYPDPVAVSFSDGNPGSGDVTRLCVGGEDPTGGSTIGNVLIDPANANRNSVECGTVPPTGVFPREMTLYAGQSAYQQTLGPLLPSLGGVPVGEHSLDAVVLDPAFDPASASGAEWQRWNDVAVAVQGFADALGSIVAHEAGHALGLVPPGAPGIGLYGGSTGAAFSHDVLADGVTSPTENHLMRAGGNFSFASLAGLSGHPLPFLRPLDFGYLRDRIRTDATITQLLLPPAITSVAPSLIANSATLTITGSSFAPTPRIRLESPGFVYELIGEAYQASDTISGYVSWLQILPGVYDLAVQNPDGQWARMLGAVEVQ